jgi:hypothetical protein
VERSGRRREAVSFGFQTTPGSAWAPPASGFTINGVAAGHDPCPQLPPSFSVADATVAKANSGTHDLAFTVTLSAAATGPVTVALCHRQRHGNGRQRLIVPDRNADLRPLAANLEGGPCPRCRAIRAVEGNNET